MQLTVTELCKIVANARGLSEDFWKQDPLYIQLSESLGIGTVAETTPYAVAEHTYSIGSVAVDLDKGGYALGIEFF